MRFNGYELQNYIVTTSYTVLQHEEEQVTNNERCYSLIYTHPCSDCMVYNNKLYKFK